MPQSKATKLCSSAAVVSQSKSTELCSSSAAVVPQSKSTEMWSSAAPFHHDLWCFPFWTAPRYLFRKTYKPAYSRATQVTKINSLNQITEKVILMWAHTFHWRLWWFPWNVWEVKCKWTSVQTQFIVLQRSPQKMWSWVSLISTQVKKTCQWTVSF